jgi:parallel beta-helix repeat protein/predicted outer membrane repeat protein
VARIDMYNSTVSGNSASEEGGGIYIHGGIAFGGLPVFAFPSPLTMHNSTVTGNSAGLDGGGLFGRFALVQLFNGTVSGNSAGDNGGGIHGEFGTIIVLGNATVTGNSADDEGGGIFAGAVPHPSGGELVSAYVALINSVVAGNDAGSGDDLSANGVKTTLKFTGGNIVGSAAVNFETVTGAPTAQIDGTDQAGLETVFAAVAADPNTLVLAGVLTDNGGPVATVAIANGGIAHNTGDDAELPVDLSDLDGDGNTAEQLPVDARGEARVSGTSVDVGAFEIQQEFVVSTADDEGFDGGNLAAEMADGNGLSLREALALANAETDVNEITFNASLAGETLVLTDGQLEVTTDGISIDGDIDGDGMADITVSGNNAGRVFFIDDGNASGTIAAALRGLVIEAGNVAGAGGGIYIGTADALTLADATVRDNIASTFGGGILVGTDATLALTRSTLSGNSATHGGALFSGTDAAITIANATVSDNSASVNGGGIRTGSDTAITLTNTTVSGNSAGDDGGAIFGGIDSIITLNNSTVSGNSAAGDGGGIANTGTAGLTTLVNSIAAGNAATGAGDDLFGGAAPSDLTFTGGNIVGSTPASFDTVTGLATNATVIDGGIQADLETVFAAVGNDPNTAVLSGVLADNGGAVETILISQLGLAHNGGDGAALPLDPLDLDNDTVTNEALPVDARGFARVFHARVDVGAVELQVAGNSQPAFEGALADGSEGVALDENAANGAPVFAVDANDGDGGATDGVSYAIVAGNVDVDGDASLPFAIDAGTGAITVNDADDLDFEDTASFVLTVETDDGGPANGTATATITVALNDLAEIFTVTTFDDEAYGGGGLADELADGSGLSLREAIGLANAGAASADTIVFAAALAGGTLTLANGHLVLSSSLTIDGDLNGDDVADITIDAQGNSRFFRVNAGTSTLDALAMTNGQYGGFGGGIRVFGGADLTIANATLADSAASARGGGIYNAGALTLVNTTLSGNDADDNGGGIYNAGTATLIETSLSENSADAGSGGGIYNAGTLRLVGATLSGNHADDSGGGIYNAGTATLIDTTLSQNSADVGGGGGILNAGTLTLANSTLAGNEAYRGGGIFNKAGNTATLTNATFSGNSAADRGGGIHSVLATLTVTNSTFSGNSATNEGGGIYIYEGTATLTNSVVAGNAAASGADLFPSTYTTPIFAGVNVFSQAGAGDAQDIVETDLAEIFAQVGADPFTGVSSGVLADNGGPVATIAILQGGVARDAATASAALPQDPQDLDGDSDLTEQLPVDARGEARVSGANVDVGAFEFQATPLTLVVTTLDDEEYDNGEFDAENNDGNGLSLREALGLANGDPDENLITFDPELLGQGTLFLTTGQELVISETITIDGDIDNDGVPDITVSADSGPDADDAGSRVFRIAADSKGFLTTSATFDGLIIEDGADLDGGGIHVGANTSLTLTGSIVRDNSASDDGGGIFVDDNASITLINSTVSGNGAGSDGGGIYGFTDATLVLANSTMSGNSAGEQGGAIFVARPGLISGGAASITLTNSTLSGNSATSGGGIYGDRNNPITLISSTVTGNSADLVGGGIANYGASGVITLTNSIVAGNFAGLAGRDLHGLVFSHLVFTGENIVGSSPVNFASETGDFTFVNGASQAALETVFAVVGNDPSTGVLSGALADNGGPVQTVAIQTGGIAQDAGDNGELPPDAKDLDGDGNTTEPLPVDARGFTRIVGTNVDVGAFELDPNDAPVVTPGTLAAVAEDTANPPGQSVGTIFAADFTDPDPSATISGILVSANTANAVTEGAWQFSTDSGASWFDIGAVSDASALALSAATLIRFVPVADFFGDPAALLVFGLDNTYAGGFTAGNTTAHVSTTPNGGMSAISDDSTTLGTTVTPVNDAPDANAVNGGDIAYLENHAATSFDPGLTVTDPDDTELEAARVTLTGFVAGQDVLSIDTSGTTIVASFNPGTGVLDLTGTALLADYQQVLRTVSYFNSSDDPSTVARTAVFEVNDGGGFVNVGDIGITVNAINDNPVLNNVPAVTDYRRGDPAVVLAAAAGVLDLDTPTFDTATVTITDVQVGDLLAADTTGTAITAVYNPGTGTLTLTGPDTLGNFQQVLRSITFETTGPGNSRALTWQLDDGEAANNLSTIVNSEINLAAAALHDFSGDGQSDIFWRDGSGTLVLWEMDGPTVLANNSVNGAMPSHWQVLDVADFNGGGRNDVLWQDTAGVVVLWEMDGPTITANTVVGTLPAHWHFEGAGDFTGDASADILWRDNAGTIVLWEMDGATIAGNSVVGNLGLDWDVEEIGDFNGDGNADILWHNDDGTVRLWEMDGATILTDTTIGTLPDHWDVVSSGDYNGDGNTDLLWRENTGPLAMWEMDGPTILDNTGLGTIPTSWDVVNSGDYNGDGNADILWRENTGTLALWELDGPTILANSSIGTVPTNWQIV